MWLLLVGYTFPVIKCIWKITSWVEDFLQSPSDQLFEQCTKDQLLKIAHHYEIEVPDTKLKEVVENALKNKLVEDEILVIEVRRQPLSSPSVNPVALTFEQQRELLVLQLEHEKIKQQRELEMEVKKLN